MKRLQQLEQRLFFWSVIVGAIFTLLTVLADATGLLTPMENWIYDHRARWCQEFNAAPSDKIVHLDIDDRAVEAVGQWPWPRARFGQMLEELHLAKPKVVGMDIVFSEPTRAVQLKNGTTYQPDDDAQFAASAQKLGNVISTISLSLRPPAISTSIQATVHTLLRANLELTPPGLSDELAKAGFSSDQVREAVKDDAFLAARRRAAFDRVTLEINSGSSRFDQIARKALPNTDLTISSPLLRLLSEQHTRAMALNATDRFSCNLPPSVVSPLSTEANLVPIESLSIASGSLGFVDIEMIEPVQRFVPLYVENGQKLYPFFGFVFGCRMIDADPLNAVITDTTITLTTPNGEVEVPVRRQYSKRFGRDVGLFADVPWFGSSDWETMYDFPAHKQSRQHYSIGLLWDIVQVRERLLKNNREADAAMESLLAEEDEQTFRFGMDATNYKNYLEKKLSNDEWNLRREMVQWTLQQLHEYPRYPEIKNPTQPLDELAKRDREVMLAAEAALEHTAAENTKLQTQLIERREFLAKAVTGKGVIIGWTATGASDMVTTSLHARCPGVVVHGVIANAVITGQWWKTSPKWVAYLLTFVFGIGVAVIVGLFRPLVGSFTAILLFVTYSLVNGYFIFDWGNHILGAAAPLSAIALVWAGATLVRAIIEGVERIRAQFEKLRLEKEKAIAEQDLAVFRHEMELAKTVQVALIPTEPPKLEGIDNCGWNKPADLTGGDCYDLWTIPDGRLGVLVADASGHGLAPAMIVSQVRTLVRTLSETDTHPDTILARVNARLSADLEASRFVTCFLGFISGEGELTWASAGHGPMLWCQGEGQEMLELESTALPLGIDGDWMGDIAPILQLNLGGMLLVMSDGIFEAPDPRKDQFGVERVVTIVKELCGRSAIEITAAIREAVTKWQQKDSPADDQTTVIIRRVPTGVDVTVVEDNPQPDHMGDQASASVSS